MILHHPLQAAALGDGHVHTAPSAVRVLCEIARRAPASYRECSLSWRSPPGVSNEQPEAGAVGGGGLQIDLVRSSPRRMQCHRAALYSWIDEVLVSVKPSAPSLISALC